MFLFEVVDTLEKNRIKYALVGGYALALHGVVRATIDVDLVVQINKTQLKSVEAAMSMIGLQSRLPINAEDIFNFREEYIKNKNMIAWSFVSYADPAKMVDIIITENLKEFNVKKVSVKGRKISLASLEDLLRMKTGTGRQKDALDVESIKRLLNE